jgi:hypothetical protein
MPSASAFSGMWCGSEIFSDANSKPEELPVRRHACADPDGDWHGGRPPSLSLTTSHFSEYFSAALPAATVAKWSTQKKSGTRFCSRVPDFRQRCAKWELVDTWISVIDGVQSGKDMESV